MHGSTDYFDKVFEVTERSTSGGRTVHLHDGALTLEGRSETSGSVTNLRQYGQVSDYDHDNVRGHLAWAAWGGRVSCTVTANGRDVPTSRPAGARAIYVGAEAFRGGAFAAADGNEASAARVFRTATGGGPVFAKMVLAGQSNGEVISDDSNARMEYGCADASCMYAYPSANMLTAVVTAGTEIGQARPNVQLWIIDIPRGA